MDKKRILVVGVHRMHSGVLAALVASGAEIVQAEDADRIQGRTYDSVWWSETGSIKAAAKTYGPVRKGKCGKTKRW